MNFPSSPSCAALGSTSRVCALLLLFVAVVGAKEKDKTKPKKADESAAFFEKATVPQLKLELAASEIESLRKDARTYVKAKLIEDGKTTYAEVAVKLKGAAGSFREIDDRPAFTLNMDRFTEDQSFHGLDKFHLNNSVQDESYLNEFITGELFRKAGVPAPRVAHARVWLNDRDLGLYVVKEGFDKGFLKQHFKDSKGNLYDGGFLQEIDGELDLDEGKGVANRSDLKALAEACKMENLAARWPRMEALLNVDSFLTFMAMELMVGHWDGYCLNRNNYRIYFDPGDQNRAKFLPHGMDQTFGDPGASLLGVPPALVAASVMQNPKWRADFRKKISSLLPLFQPATSLESQVDKVAAKLKPALEAMGGDTAKNHEDRVRELKERLVARAENLVEQNKSPEPKPVEFDDKGRASLSGWATRTETGNPGFEELAEEGKLHQYMIQGGDNEDTKASWRTTVLLDAGKYRLVGKVKTKDVKADDDEKGVGAGFRISGEKRTNKLVGTSAWKELSFDFQVDGLKQVELVAELRAKNGQAWFDAASMHLKLVKP